MSAVEAFSAEASGAPFAPASTFTSPSGLMRIRMCCSSNDPERSAKQSETRKIPLIRLSSNDNKSRFTLVSFLKLDETLEP
jgi:hypothetical protein